MARANRQRHSAYLMRAAHQPNRAQQPLSAGPSVPPHSSTDPAPSPNDSKLPGGLAPLRNSTNGKPLLTTPPHPHLGSKYFRGDIAPLHLQPQQLASTRKPRRRNSHFAKRSRPGNVSHLSYGCRKTFILAPSS